MNKKNQLLYSAREKQSSGQYIQALLIYQQILSSDENNWEVWFEMGACFYCSQDYERALECSLKATEIHPEEELIWYNASLACCQLEREEEALTYVDKALELSPNYLAALLYRAEINFSINEFSQAIMDFSQSLNHPSLDLVKRAQVLHKRGYCYGQSNSTDFALLDFANSLKLIPDNWKCLKDRAHLYYLENQLEKALDDLNSCLEIHDNMEIRYLKGAVCLKMKRNTEACENLMAFEEKLS